MQKFALKKMLLEVILRARSWVEAIRKKSKGKNGAFFGSNCCSADRCSSLSFFGLKIVVVLRRIKCEHFPFVRKWREKEKKPLLKSILEPKNFYSSCPIEFFRGRQRIQHWQFGEEKCHIRNIWGIMPFKRVFFNMIGIGDYKTKAKLIINGQRTDDAKNCCCVVIFPRVLISSDFLSGPPNQTF